MKKILLIISILSLFITANAQTEIGIASYYGSYFHGRTTANGEKYNQFGLTAAHKTLPLGTVVKVTNLQNSKSVFVRINDRGPYVKGRVIDLSTKAAQMLGYKNKGTAKVKIEVLEENTIPEDLMEASTDIAKINGVKVYDSTDSWENIPTVMDHLNEKTEDKNIDLNKNTSNLPVQPVNATESNLNGITNRSPYYIITNLDKTKAGFYGLQLGVFSDMSVIFDMIETLQKYNQNIVVRQEEVNGKKMFRLFVGKFQNKAYADALKTVLIDKYADSFVVKYE